MSLLLQITFCYVHTYGHTDGQHVSTMLFTFTSPSLLFRLCFSFWITISFSCKLASFVFSSSCNKHQQCLLVEENIARFVFLTKFRPHWNKQLGWHLGFYKDFTTLRVVSVFFQGQLSEKSKTWTCEEIAGMKRVLMLRLTIFEKNV